MCYLSLNNWPLKMEKNNIVFGKKLIEPRVMI